MSNEILRSVRVAPSILSADFARLGDQVQDVLDAGARIIHVDVMDGHFVPPITIGPLIVEALAAQVNEVGGLLDVHLMIDNPDRHVVEFAKAGADSITFHYEATAHVDRTIHLIRENNATAGLAINPGTAALALVEVAQEIDLALCMTVNPGWGGQEFIAHSLDKLGRLAPMLGDEVALQVDGGIDADTAASCRAAGASIFVAGSAVFGAADPGEAYRAIAGAAGAA